MIAAIVLWDVMRWATFCLIAANLGGIGVVIVLYARRAASGPWWSRMLPQHVWRVVLGTGLMMISDFLGLIHRLRAAPPWYGTPVIFTANIFIAWGVVYMLGYQRHRLQVARRPPGYKRDTDPPVEP